MNKFHWAFVLFLVIAHGDCFQNKNTEHNDKDVESKKISLGSINKGLNSFIVPGKSELGGSSLEDQVSAIMKNFSSWQPIKPGQISILENQLNTLLKNQMNTLLKPTPQKPATQKPKPITQKPKPITRKPKPSTQKPKPTTQQPKPTSQQPIPTTQKPKPTTQKPKPTTQQPKPTTQQPILTTTKPKPTTQKPQPTTPKPQPTTQKPQPTTQQTKPTTQKPQPTTQKPSITTPKPSPPMPSTFTPKPAIVEQSTPQPSVQPTQSGYSQFAKEGLESHNRRRTTSPHYGTLLELDEKLCQGAQAYADTLAKRDSGLKHSKRSSRRGQGENLAYQMGMGKVKAEFATKNWYNEKDTGEQCMGHYTAVVWKSSKKFCMAFAVSKSGAYYTVARYSPPGNVNGQKNYRKNVHPTFVKPC